MIPINERSLGKKYRHTFLGTYWRVKVDGKVFSVFISFTGKARK
jgi:hypothetical protein